MSDRLKELQSQRALVQKQLAWLDGEIATMRSTLPALEVAPQKDARPSTIAVAPPGELSRDQSIIDATAEEILAQYKKEGQSVEGRVKRGCFLYFFIALVLLGMGVFALYLFRSRT